MKKVLIYAQQFGFASTLVGPLEVFAYTGTLWNYLTCAEFDRRFTVQVASLDGRPVLTRTGLKIEVDLAVLDADDADVILITSCGEAIDACLQASAPVIPWLQQQAARGALIGSICTGMVLLAAAGLLDGKRATTHWGMFDTVRGCFPKVQLEPDQLYIEEGNIITAGGGYAGNDLALYLVEKLCGKEIARQCANALMLDTGRTSQSMYAGIMHHRMHHDERVQSIQQWLEQNFNADINLDELARQYGMSPRNFKRRFTDASGETPLNYLQKLRVEAAKHLLDGSSVQIEQVAEQVGYRDVNHFRRLFKRHAGMTPARFRAINR
ncbi:GlxA family transcriptional regulator [Ketobacter sp.]|uniref:GlxA family transcriptional regulator n=1 Tax=Ketobacter sp. TaxID=2083498 RepID=UPI000F1DE07B|nr:helix-turn-helix domain-containing protein [Ketobacter sp.]RLU01843.1 MAG: helix-turn-helix domain-containing protein [Ketobacter sp.]